jgi:hypothetical protein
MGDGDQSYPSARLVRELPAQRLHQLVKSTSRHALNAPDKEEDLSGKGAVTCRGHANKCHGV